MASERYLALLRGINVGGRNIIKKDELKSCFEDLGFENVRTYIQSGNILFRAARRGSKNLAREVEAGLSIRFKYEAQAVVYSVRQYNNAVSAAFDGWGEREDWKHNAMFTLDTTTPAQVLNALPVVKDRIEKVGKGPRVIFWSASRKDYAKASFMELPRLAVYKQLTVRNHNTVFKLQKLFGEI